MKGTSGKPAAKKTATKTAGMKKAATKKKSVAKKAAKNAASKQRVSAIDPIFAPVIAAFANDPHVTRKRMFSSENVLTVHGKIFAMLVKGRFVAKLPQERVDQLVSGDVGEYFDPGHGRLMKEWVTVGKEGPAWVELATEAYVFVKATAY